MQFSICICLDFEIIGVILYHKQLYNGPFERVFSDMTTGMNISKVIGKGEQEGTESDRLAIGSAV